jgi:hypothetical protein
MGRAKMKSFTEKQGFQRDGSMNGMPNQLQQGCFSALSSETDSPD